MLKKKLRNQKGFTLIEIIAVLVILGILAAVAIPKYIDIQLEARRKAAVGQVAEVKGRLSTAMAGYMLSTGGGIPGTGLILINYANAGTTQYCPTASTLEGDFQFVCASGGNTSVLITVSAVQGITIAPSLVGTFSF